MLSIATLMGFACAHAQTPRASHTQTQCGRSRDVGRSAGRRSGRPTFISVHLVSCWNSETFVFQYLSNFASKSLGTHSRAHRPGRNRAAARRRGGVTDSRVAIAKSQSKPLATQATHLSSDGSSPDIVALCTGQWSTNRQKVRDRSHPRRPEELGARRLRTRRARWRDVWS